jgi:CheY-like chemotaxis protein
MNKRRTLNLLLVTDDPGDVGHLQMAVQQSGYAVELHVARDALSALQFLRRQGTRFQHAPRPDLILLDINTPGEETLETLAAVKQDNLLRAIPVVVISTSERESDVHAAYRLGAAGYVIKPADINEFADTFNKLAQYWFERTKLPENCTAHTDKSGRQCGHNE